MKRKTAAAGVLLAVAIFAVVVSGATGDTFTTDSDFQGATTLTNLTIDGTGESASLFLEGSLKSLSRDADTTSTGSFTGVAGIEIETRREITETTVVISSQTSGVSGVELQDTSGSTIETASVSGGEATFQTDLSADTKYHLVVEASTMGIDSSPSFPYVGSNVNITAGVSSSGTTTQAEASGIVTVKTRSGDVSDGLYVSQRFQASDLESGTVDVSPGTGSIDVIWEEDDDGDNSWSTITSATVSSAGVNTQSFGSQFDRVRVRAEFNPASDTDTMELHNASVDFTAASPTVDNSSASPSGGEKLTSDPVSFSIQINDSDFATEQGDTVTVEWFVNGTKEATKTYSQNTTASADISVDQLGMGQWHVELSDTYGNSQTSETFIFEAPSVLTFRNESNASEIISGETITATFYDTNGELVIERSDNNGDGNISLQGLPNTAFVVTFEGDGWYDRRIFIEDIYSQSRVYLLNSTAFPTGDDSAIETTFVYEDRTGAFEQANTTLRVQRAVDPNNDSEFQWETVAGDYWGAAGEFPFTGEYQERYRLRIKNQETGESRTLGTHIPVSDGLKNIVIGQIIFDADNATGRYFDAALDQNTSTIQAYYQDPTDATTDLRIIVYEHGNASNELFNSSFAGPHGEQTVTVSLTDAQVENNWIVAYRATHASDGAIDGQAIVGGAQLPLPIDPVILTAFAYAFVTFIMALYGPRVAVHGSWAGVLVFGGLMFVGWLDWNIPALLVAVAAATGGTLYKEAMP